MFLPSLYNNLNIIIYSDDLYYLATYNQITNLLNFKMNINPHNLI